MSTRSPGLCSQGALRGRATRAAASGGSGPPEKALASWTQAMGKLLRSAPLPSQGSLEETMRDLRRALLLLMLVPGWAEAEALLRSESAVVHEVLEGRLAEQLGVRPGDRV